MAHPSLARAMPAGDKARPAQLCAAEGCSVAAPSPLTQMVLGSWMTSDEVPTARCAPEMIKMRTFSDGSG